MDRPPAEILDRVFQLACTDDGFTGRSLSAVSTRIRTISAPHKYYSIHVSGAKRIANFASFLKGHRAPVQYLKLDCTTLGVKPSQTNVVYFLGGELIRVQVEELDNICENTAIIFLILATELKGLYLIPTVVPLQFKSIIFPFLNTFFLFDSHCEVSIQWNSLYFPALRRLDISCDASTEDGHKHAYAELNLPALTHFGCCYHNQEGGIWSLLTSFVNFGKRGGLSILKETPGFNAYLNWHVLRLGTPNLQLPQLLAKIEDLQSLEGFPLVTAREHELDTEDNMHTEEWNYVVEGGKGFLPTPS